MKLIFLTLMALISISCGKNEFGDLIKKNEDDPRKFNKTNPIFTPYVQKFVNKHIDIKGEPIQTSHIPINFDNLESTQIGVCYWWDDGKREILIDSSEWAVMNECDKYLLIAHELGHCSSLNRKHYDKTYKETPLSVMNTYHIGGDEYCKLEAEYDEELHSRNTSLLRDALDLLFPDNEEGLI